MTDYGYGLWGLVIFDSVLMIAFAFSFFRPRSKLDWRALGGFSAFIGRRGARPGGARPTFLPSCKLVACAGPPDWRS